MKKPDTQNIIIWMCIAFLISLLTSCGQCNRNLPKEDRTFTLQLITGDTITKTFSLPKGTEVYVETYKGSYYLQAVNYHACMHRNILSGVVYIID